MRKGFIMLFFMLITAMQAEAQKIDIDKKSVSTSLLSLPSEDVDSSWHTYSYKFNGSYHLGTWGLDQDATKEKYFKLEGYRLVDQDGDLQIEATLSPIKFLDSKVESRVEKSKDKSGRETSKSYYKHVLTYESGFSWKVKDKNGKELTNKLLSLQNTSVKKHTGNEFNTYKEASDSYQNNRVQINRDIASGEILGFLGGMNQRINSQYGYRFDKEKFNIWLLDTKSHPEYAAFQSNYEGLKAAFEAVQATGLTQSDLDAIQPSIDYYTSIPQKYKADEKADTKLRYAAYFNLANIYLYLDNASKVSEYANLIIKNDYDKGDGKDFLKDAEKLERLLVEKRVNSRRFQRN